MSEPTAASTPPGLPLLRHWRRLRALTQLALGELAGVSSRHISFLESGRARPTPWMLEILAEALAMPPVDRDKLHEQAGFTSRRGVRDLSRTLAALDVVLVGIDPYPCVVIDRHARIVKRNAAASALLVAVATVDEGEPATTVAELVLRERIRGAVTNLDTIAPSLLARWRRQAVGDAEMEALVARVLDDPGVPDRWKSRIAEPWPDPHVVLEVALGEARLSFLVTCASLGTAADETFDELWIQTVLPRDAATESFLRALAPAVDAKEG